MDVAYGMEFAYLLLHQMYRTLSEKWIHFIPGSIFEGLTG